MNAVTPTAPRALVAHEPARFHLSLNSRDLAATVAFFRAFLGIEPAKCRPDYAKFELDDPPLVLALEPYAAPAGGNLNHLGFRVASSAALVEIQRRLELAGISTRREEGVECCYARQTKFWVHDPDGNLWEIYTLDEDLAHRGDGGLPLAPPTNEAGGPGPAAALWGHRIGQPFPHRLPILDQTVDDIQLQGTFNERLPPATAQHRLTELFRIARPGATVHLHVLTSDRPLGDQPLQLPGPAAAVQQVWVDQELLAAFTSAGFHKARFAYRANSPCFRIGDAELRETRIEADRP